ncbi:hypothetical protein EUGRSUZ_D02222 [Eucalyptus grandis]|uniref:Uncharacterized protein n=2 Tax=Eucalyptus grandis TaxID=71139 RepID=A0ACC3L9F8_EUCGR|nr:hypothetical protein EUGRSUZ_D02222 [Eucalyptus grandis]
MSVLPVRVLTQLTRINPFSITFRPKVQQQKSILMRKFTTIKCKQTSINSKYSYSLQQGKDSSKASFPYKKL